MTTDSKTRFAPYANPADGTSPTPQNKDRQTTPQRGYPENAGGPTPSAKTPKHSGAKIGPDRDLKA